MNTIKEEFPAGVTLIPQSTQANYLPAAMCRRFVEVIQLDLNHLLAHANDAAYCRHNLLMLRGFVINLGVSYADQNCYDFLQLLTDLQIDLRQLAKADVDKKKVLAQMATRVSAFLDTLFAESGDE